MLIIPTLRLLVDMIGDSYTYENEGVTHGL